MGSYTQCEERSYQGLFNGEKLGNEFPMGKINYKCNAYQGDYS